MGCTASDPARTGSSNSNRVNQSLHLCAHHVPHHKYHSHFSPKHIHSPKSRTCPLTASSPSPSDLPSGTHPASTTTNTTIWETALPKPNLNLIALLHPSPSLQEIQGAEENVQRMPQGCVSQILTAESQAHAVQMAACTENPLGFLNGHSESVGLGRGLRVCLCL